MKSATLDDQIRHYYQAQRPSPEVLARLKQQMAGVPRRPRKRMWMASAAVFAVALTALVWSTASRRPSPQDTAVVIARQAALGHNERQELEFQVTSCAELQREMKSLDFNLVEPAMVRDMGMRMIGARYAMLGGEMAAQILYVDEHGVPCTLYEARPVDELALVATGDHQIDGLRVSVWKEKGLLMVLARPMA